ncbi:hypothetical protein COCNU_scaffold060974G000050 [Cocos nucifera]|nr:hypothetical protein [Cocos nucifera]
MRLVTERVASPVVMAMSSGCGPHGAYYGGKGATRPVVAAILPGSDSRSSRKQALVGELGHIEFGLLEEFGQRGGSKGVRLELGRCAIVEEFGRRESSEGARLLRSPIGARPLRSSVGVQPLRISAAEESDWSSAAEELGRGAIAEEFGRRESSKGARPLRSLADLRRCLGGVRLKGFG